MEKGEKIIFLYSSPSLKTGVGYYLFPLEDPIYNHLITEDKELVDKITDPSNFVSMHKNGLIPFGSVSYVKNSDIRSYSEDLETRITKRLAFVEPRLDQYKTYFPKYWEVFNKIGQFDYAFVRIVVNYYVAKLRFKANRLFNIAIYPVLGIFLFDLFLIFQLHGDYRNAIDNFKQKKRRLQNRNPLTPRTEEDELNEKVELEALDQKVETARSNLLKSNRAIITFLLAILAFLGSQYLAKRTELVLNERINILQRENQSLKKNENDLTQQITNLQKETEALQKQKGKFARH